MKVSTISMIRTLIVAALIMAAIAGIVEFHNEPMFADFLVPSVGILIFAIPLIWIDWFWRHGVSFLHIGIASIVGFDALALWSGGNLRDTCFVAVFFFAIWVALIRKTTCPLNADQQRANLKANRTEDIRILHVLSNTVGFVGCFTSSAVLWCDPRSRKWAILLLFPMPWFAWRVIWHLFIRLRSSNRGNDSIKEAVSEGPHP